MRRAKSITLYIDDDIEFMTPEEFDVPTPAQIQREQTTAIMMDLWVQEYNERMGPRRLDWLNYG